MSFNVYVVTVTYNNRFHLLKQVIDSALAEGVAKVIVVDNNSVPESREKLRAYEKELGIQKIKVLYLDNNYGSAGGYKRGLEEAYNDPECEFIWLLDDDNKPLSNSLDILIKCWQKNTFENNEINKVFVSYRYEQISNFAEIIIKNDKEPVKELNAFLGYSFKNLFYKLIKKITLLIKKDKKKNSLIIKNNTLLNVKYSYYGGMFFNKKLLDLIGYPDDRFFVYVDDTEWSYRIIKKGGKIFLCLNSLIEELEKSFYTQKSIFEYNTFRVYYAIRNAVYFEKNNFVSNKYIYYFNMIMFKTLLLLYALFFGKIGMYKIVFKAIKDGLNGNLGNTF